MRKSRLVVGLARESNQEPTLSGDFPELSPEITNQQTTIDDLIDQEDVAVFALESVTKKMLALEALVEQLQSGDDAEVIENDPIVHLAMESMLRDFAVESEDDITDVKEKTKGEAAGVAGTMLKRSMEVAKQIFKKIVDGLSILMDWIGAFFKDAATGLKEAKEKLSLAKEEKATLASSRGLLPITYRGNITAQGANRCLDVYLTNLGILVDACYNTIQLTAGNRGLNNRNDNGADAVLQTAEFFVSVTKDLQWKSVDDKTVQTTILDGEGEMFVKAEVIKGAMARISFTSGEDEKDDSTVEAGASTDWAKKDVVALVTKAENLLKGVNAARSTIAKTKNELSKLAAIAISGGTIQGKPLMVVVTELSSIIGSVKRFAVKPASKGVGAVIGLANLYCKSAGAHEPSTNTDMVPA